VSLKGKQNPSDRLILALPKGRLFDPSLRLLKRVGITADGLTEEGRRLTVDLPEQRLRLMIVRAVDVPTYVEYGAADIGIVGKDQLLEQNREVYEPLDLEFGHCRVVLAEPAPGARPPVSVSSKVRVATKYPNITERFFSEKGIPVEIIKLYGSIELAPLVGLADQIVDLSATGETLRQHGLRVLEEITTSTARLIVNRASLKIKHARIKLLIRDIKSAIGKTT
jgi:ATP phosphoribosyltransferase